LELRLGVGVGYRGLWIGLEIGDWKLGMGMDWDWGLILGIEIRDWDLGFRLGI